MKGFLGYEKIYHPIRINIVAYASMGIGIVFMFIFFVDLTLWMGIIGIVLFLIGLCTKIFCACPK